MILSVKLVRSRSTTPAFRNCPAQCSEFDLSLSSAPGCGYLKFAFSAHKNKRNWPNSYKRRKKFRIRGAVLRCGADIKLDISVQGLILPIIGTKDDYFSRFEDRKVKLQMPAARSTAPT